MLKQVRRNGPASGLMAARSLLSRLILRIPPRFTPEQPVGCRSPNPIVGVRWGGDPLCGDRWHVYADVSSLRESSHPQAGVLQLDVKRPNRHVDLAAPRELIRVLFHAVALIRNGRRDTIC